MMRYKKDTNNTNCSVSYADRSICYGAHVYVNICGWVAGRGECKGAYNGACQGDSSRLGAILGSVILACLRPHNNQGSD